ncbi:glycoside hydrolase family 97 protein [candidate division KSB1 bacterium]|nr:glycoside hydrolase family 97 protein [candidate division KSB1 bacterium]
MNKRIISALKILTMAIVFCNCLSAHATEKSYQLFSPDKKIEVKIHVQDKITFSILHNGQEMLAPSSISMTLDDNRVLGASPSVKSAKTRSVKEEIKPVLPEKRKIIPEVYNELELAFSGNYGVRFRAYDDGVAYRFFTNLAGNIIIKHEEVSLNFAANDSIYFPEEESFMSHSERLYKFLAVKDVTDKQMCSLPALVVKPNGTKLAISEADLLDYAGLYLHGSGDGTATLKSKFPLYPLEEKLERDRDLPVVRAADYIAQTTGRRNFPWRVIATAKNDGDLITNDIIYRLGSPLALKDTGWIKPGKVAWDWWNANNIFGVDFKSGVNTATYKYYIDFASRYGIDHIILDEGWSVPADLFQINPDMNIEELFAYAKTKNVGIIPWVLWNALDKDFDRALDQFEKWGAKGIKVDFMQRDDQKMVNFYEKVAKAAAEHHLLVDFHGAYKPTGLRRTYPNVLTREGVRGLEWNKWSKDVTPKHDVTLPFIRMFAGPMDYTPGAMINATANDFRDIFNRPMSQGTHCHQLAMYVVFESPLQMLADSPSHYLKEPECMEFLSAVPTVWDETRVLNAKVGEYITVARKHGDNWYIGAMTNWMPRDFELDLSFLGAGNFKMTFWADGINADRYASDYKKQTRMVTRIEKLKVHLAPGGGWAAMLVPEK